MAAAVNLASQPAEINKPAQYQYPPPNLYPQQPTPLSSAPATPSTMSPTSPRTASNSPANQHLQTVFTRQLHPPKAPLYTPAVLRPTERPKHAKSSSSHSVVRISANSSSITPPSSTEGSPNTREGEALVEESLQRRLLVNDGIARVVTDEWNDETLEKVTGMPTRDHWKPDSSSPTCDYPPCPNPFTLLRRRHHCRRCGNIFCATHSDHQVPLDQHARFHPHGAMARACENCWGDFMAWKKRRDARDGSTSEASSGSGVATPIDGRRANDRSKSGNKGNSKDTLAVGSVPRDWNWSTF